MLGKLVKPSLQDLNYNLETNLFIKNSRLQF